MPLLHYGSMDNAKCYRKLKREVLKFELLAFFYKPNASAVFSASSNTFSNLFKAI